MCKIDSTGGAKVTEIQIQSGVPIQKEQVKAQEPQPYPKESFVDTYQKSDKPEWKGKTAEQRQAGAYKEFCDKHIPDLQISRLDDKMIAKLGVAHASPPSSMADIKSELRSIQDKGLIVDSERQLIEKEADTFAKLYKEAFPKMPEAEVLLLARDNARKLAYQTARDKEVFVGSDHGTKHILEGNIKLADQMLAGLKKQGVTVTPLDKVLVHQAMIDHDIGYTVDPAQTSFAASKDHPLFSAKYLETHSQYYDKYFPGCKDALFDAVLNHSYIKSDFTPDKAHEGQGFNLNILRSVTSIPDSLGVTAEIKCPAFWREPDVLVELSRLQFAQMVGGYSGDQLSKYVDNVKANLKMLLSFKTEIPEERRKAIEHAIDNNITKDTAKFALPQYAGVMDGISMEKVGEKVMPVVDMGVIHEQMMLATMFGDEVALKGLTKALEDLGVAKDIQKSLPELLSVTEKSGDRGIEFGSEKALFRFFPRREEPDPKLKGVFDDMASYTDFSARFLPKIGPDFEKLKSKMDSILKNMSIGYSDLKPLLENTINEFSASVTKQVRDGSLKLSSKEQIRFDRFVGQLRDAGTNEKAIKEILDHPGLTPDEKRFLDYRAAVELAPPPHAIRV